MDPQFSTALVAFLTGGVGLEIVRAVIKRWQESVGRREQAETRYNRLMEACLRARAAAIKRGATDEELGPLPE